MAPTAIQTLVLAFAWATVLMVAFAAGLAMLGDGTIIINFNSINEGWLEFTLLVLVATLFPWAVARG